MMSPAAGISTAKLAFVRHFIAPHIIGMENIQGPTISPPPISHRSLVNDSTVWKWFYGRRSSRPWKTLPPSSTIWFKILICLSSVSALEPPSLCILISISKTLPYKIIFHSSLKPTPLLITITSGKIKVLSSRAFSALTPYIPVWR